MASAKMASAIGVSIDDVGSILKFRIGFLFRENSAPVCRHRFRFLEKIFTGGFAKGGFCRHDFMKTCVEGGGASDTCSGSGSVLLGST